MKHTFLLIATLPLLNIPEVTPEKFLTLTVQLLMSQPLGSLNLISPNFTRCTEMIGNYSAEIKIAIFQFVSKWQRDE